jgi:hypothetical protein
MDAERFCAQNTEVYAAVTGIRDEYRGVLFT